MPMSHILTVLPFKVTIFAMHITWEFTDMFRYQNQLLYNATYESYEFLLPIAIITTTTTTKHHIEHESLFMVLPVFNSEQKIKSKQMCFESSHCQKWAQIKRLFENFINMYM